MSKSVEPKTFPPTFLITSGQYLNHPYRGTSYPIGDLIVVVEERWINDVQLPFEGHLYVSLIKGTQKISGPTLLFPNSHKYFYNPNFVKTSSGIFLYFNVFDPITDKASFERSEYNNQAFGQPQPMTLTENLDGQYRPWFFISSSYDNQVVLTYEWRDPVTKKNRLKISTSSDGFHFNPSKDMAVGVMARHNFFQDGSQIFTYQNGDPKNMIDFFSLSKTGFQWSPFQPVTHQRNVHDVVPFRRLDGNIDLYYIATGTGSPFSIFRRSVNKHGSLGPEEELSDKAQGPVMQL